MAVSNPTLAIAAAHGSGASSYDTGAVSFTAGRLYAVVVEGNAAGIADPTPTSVSNTWAKITSVPWDLNPGATRNLSAWRCLSASTVSEVVNIAWAGTTTTLWAVVEVASGFDTSGSNGSGAIGDSDTVVDATGVATTVAVPTLTLASGASAVIAAFSHRLNEAHTPKAGWNELADDLLASTHSLEVQWLAGDPDASVSWTTGKVAAGIAFEVKADASAAVRNLASAGAGT